MKIVVQMSGGIESTTLIAKAIKEVGKENVFPIGFNDDTFSYKMKESYASKQVIRHYQLQQNVYICSCPHWDDFEYPLSADFPDFGFVPGMKLIMNMISQAYAQKIGADEVWIGNMNDNVYSDENKDNVKHSAELFNTIYGKNIKIVAPFQNMSKSDVIVYADSIGVPLEITNSCGNESFFSGYNCGICDWCVKRREAFKQAYIKSGVIDKSVYPLLREKK